jgi:hypothetical protein
MSFYVVAMLLAAPLAAETTRVWEQTRYDEFEKGTADKVALLSDGSLILAPRFVELYDAPTAYLWALARDSKGNLYAGGGPGARVFKITGNGKAERFFETDALEIQALAVDGRDHVYAATSPDAKIYRIDPAGKATLFADPKVKYVWALALNGRGELLAATGDKGEVLKFDAAGKATPFFRCDEAHLRSMLVEPNGDVVVGTDPGGLVIRIPAAGGSGFVVHQSSKKEVTALTRDAAGAIYVAAVGTRTRQAVPPPAAPALPAPTAPPAPAPSTLGAQLPQPATPQPLVLPVPATRAAVTGGSEVLRITADGAPLRLWSSNEEVAYALGFGAGGKLLVATGNNGRIYQVESERLHALLVKAAPSQITALLEGPEGRVYVATGNVGKVYRLGPELEPKGTFESEVFDAGVFSRWGRLSWEGEVTGGSRVGVQVRSGNLATPTQYWSAWSKPVTHPDGDRVDSPPARFVQWRATLEAAGSASPVLKAVWLAYLSKNRAPAITELELTPPNHKFPDPSPLTPTKTLSLSALGSRPAATTATPPQAPRTMNPAKGFRGARWLAQDENEDDLIYTVEVRGVQEQGWKLLRKDLDQPYLSWDTAAFADGFYVLRVTASDERSNPGDGALAHRRETEPFRIDNTPPAIVGLAAAREGAKLRVRFRAVDALSWIEDTEYAVDGGDWKQISPATGLFDGKELEYDFATGEVQPGEHTVAVRVSDEFENQGLAKVVVR